MVSFSDLLSFTLPSISLPAIPLPANIQRRFLSFLLRRTLGHLVKPGQLDISQIEAQIGDGRVEIKDVELDPQAINLLLDDLPLELREGAIGKVAAQIPLPNIFTAPFALSLSSLHLTFLLRKPPVAPVPPPTTNLAESVTSVAETFLHDELTERENRIFRESVQGGVENPFEEEEDRLPPGSINPYLEDDANEDTSLPHEQMEDDGVGMLAMLVERLLARFSFAATDIQIRIVHPSETEYTLLVPEVAYATEEDVGENILKVRTVRVSGVTFSVKDVRSTGSLRHVSSSGSISSETEGVPSAVESSSEDDVPMSMYQSTASLRTSTMYHSTTSSRPQPQNPSDPPSPTQPLHRSSLPTPPRDEVVFSLASEPIVVRINNVFPAAPTVPLSSSPLASSPSSQAPLHMSQETVRVVTEMKKSTRTSVDVTLGIVAIALKSTHIRAFIASVRFVLPSSSAARTVPKTDGPSSSSGGPQMRFQLKLKGIVGLLLQDRAVDDALVQSFFAHPLSRPIPSPHIRVHLDAIEASLSDGAFNPSSITAIQNTKGLTTSPSPSSRQVASLAVSDISVFLISRSVNLANDGGDSWTASPILIHDVHLAHQYDVNATAFPVFEVSDWRKTEGLVVRPSQWRAKITPHTKRRPTSTTSAILASSAPNTPAVRVRKELGTSLDIAEVSLEPLHVFVDLQSVGEVEKFVSEAFAGQDVGQPAMAYAEVVAQPDPPPKAGFADVLGDLDAQNERMAKSDDGPAIVVRCPVIRLEVRAPPPPPKRSDPIVDPPKLRSGAFVLDVHGLRIVGGGGSANARSAAATRFAANQPSSGGRRSSRKRLLGQLEWSRVVISLAGANEPRATTFVSVGPILGKTPGQDIILPVVYLRTAVVNKPDDASSTSIECRVPSVQIKLDKPTLDSAQLWADDCAQWAERTFGDAPVSRSGTDTGNPSLIGSRYFAQNNQKTMASFATVSSKTATSLDNGKKRGEVVVSLVVSEATVHLFIPRGPAEGTLESRPLEILTSDLDALVEVKPEGKNETAVSLSVADVKVTDTAASGEVSTFLELTNLPMGIAAARPLVKVRLTSTSDPYTGAKQSSIRVTASGFTYTLTTDISWISDLERFVKAPPGVFEGVVPNERTRIWLKVHDGSLRVLAPNHQGSLVISMEEVEFLTELVSESVETNARLRVPCLCVLFIDDVAVSATTAGVEGDRMRPSSTGLEKWTSLGYAFIAQVTDLDLDVLACTQPVSSNINIDKLRLSLHLCADTVSAIAAFGADFASPFQSADKTDVPESPKTKTIHVTRKPKRDMFSSIDENAFKSAPEVDMPGDMMRDDLPTNLDYLDAAYGAAGGINAYSDEDDFEDDFSEGNSTRGPATPTPSTPESSVLTNTRGETIRMLDPRGINIIEDYYETITPVEDEKGPLLDYALVARVRVKDTEVMVHLHDGYDWLATRKAIEDEVRAMRRKLMKIRQLLASGQVPDESVEETHTLLFNSVHIGLPQNVDEMETGELMAAIDEELKSNDEDETATQSSWQSLNRSMGASPSARTPSQLATPKPHRVRGRKLTRSKHSRIDVCLYGLEAEVDKLHPNESEGTSRTLVKVKDIEILDHIKTSTWKKFLTEIKSDSKGNIRETDSYMARVELKMVKPTQNLEQEEARLRMKLLPLRLHVDQDALDFLKAFGSFSAPQGSPPPSTKPKSSSDETYFQHVEVFPVALKLDYKPKRVDYKALREGRTIELMNFFHFDGAEMTLRHIKLSGIQGWATLGERLNDLWTPDVKANQMVDVISGIAPIRSVVNVGSGFADLILLPISQYKKDGRLVRGLQKGAKSFVKTTAMEAVKLGAKLATGTQVILEEAENMLGGTKVGVVAEPLEAGYATAMIASPHMSSRDTLAGSSSEEGSDAETDIRSARSPVPGPSDVAPHIISRYADQPHDVREGVEAAYKVLGKNLNSAAQTILAVPMEVYERSGNEGAVKKVIRAVPIAVLKPMIGATEAVSKTLLGLRNTLDPENRLESQEKYKR